MLRIEHLLVQLLRTFLGCLSASYMFSVSFLAHGTT